MRGMALAALHMLPSCWLGFSLARALCANLHHPGIDCRPFPSSGWQPPRAPRFGVFDATVSRSERDAAWKYQEEGVAFFDFPRTGEISGDQLAMLERFSNFGGSLQSLGLRCQNRNHEARL